MREYINVKPKVFYDLFGLDFEMNFKHMAVLHWMCDFAGYLDANKENQVVVDGGIAFYWFDYLKIYNDMPYLFQSNNKETKDASKKRKVFKVLSEMIDHKVILARDKKFNRGEGKTRFAFTTKALMYKAGVVPPSISKNIPLDKNVQSIGQKHTKGLDENIQSLLTKTSNNSKLSNSKLNDSNTLGSTTFFVELFAKLETTYLQQFVEQPSNTWLKKQQNKYTQEEIEEIFLSVEAYCVEHTGYCKKRKNLGRVFTQFAKDLKKDVAVSSYILDAFTIFFKAKGLDLKADKMSKTAKSQMQNITKQVEEHYGTKLNAKRLSSFLSLVKKELWYDKNTKLYTVAYLNNKIAEAIALLPKKKKTAPSKINLQVNEFITTFGREITMDKHNDLEEYALRHRIREAMPFFKGALGAAKFTTTQQVKNVYIAFLKAWADKSYPSDKASVLKSVIK